MKTEYVNALAIVLCLAVFLIHGITGSTRFTRAVAWLFALFSALALFLVLWRLL